MGLCPVEPPKNQALGPQWPRIGLRFGVTLGPGSRSFWLAWWPVCLCRSPPQDTRELRVPTHCSLSPPGWTRPDQGGLYPQVGRGPRADTSLLGTPGLTPRHRVLPVMPKTPPHAPSLSPRAPHEAGPVFQTRWNVLSSGAAWPAEAGAAFLAKLGAAGAFSRLRCQPGGGREAVSVATAVFVVPYFLFYGLSNFQRCSLWLPKEKALFPRPTPGPAAPAPLLHGGHVDAPATPVPTQTSPTSPRSLQTGPCSPTGWGCLPSFGNRTLAPQSWATGLGGAG